METIKNQLRVKTFVFPIDEAENGEADNVVNTFCSTHRALSIVLDRHNGKLIYRVIYRQRQNNEYD